MGLNLLYGEEEGSELIRKNSLDFKMSVEIFFFRLRYIFYMIFLLICIRYGISNMSINLKKGFYDWMLE